MTSLSFSPYFRVTDVVMDVLRKDDPRRRIPADGHTTMFKKDMMFSFSDVLGAVTHLLESENLQYVQVQKWIVFLSSEFDFVFQVIFSALLPVLMLSLILSLSFVRMSPILPLSISCSILRLASS